MLLLRHKHQEHNNPLASFTICLYNSALTFRDFVPGLEILTIFRDFLFSEKYENVSNESFQWLLQIIFGSIFNIYHWHSDFMLHHHRFRVFFGTVLRIFLVEFVRVMLYKQRIRHDPTAHLR